MMRSKPLTAPSVQPGSTVHLGDNFTHLLFALADVSGQSGDRQAKTLVLFIDDHYPLTPTLLDRLRALVGAEIATISDDDQIEEFARLPSFAPSLLRRNVSLSDHGALLTPNRWAPKLLRDRHFETGYVYHPGFFLSKVIGGRCERVVMRDSGYSNYVQHRVPLGRVVPRLVSRRPLRYQTWGEEPWIDEIEVVRPDQLPAHVRHKAHRRTLDDVRANVSASHAAALAHAFWGPTDVPDLPRPESTALLITQPIDDLGMCTTEEAQRIYGSIADRLGEAGFDVVVKPHPRETEPKLADVPSLPALFPIEAWTWLGQPPFGAAVALSSAALSASEATLALTRTQLVPPDLFYPRHRDRWPAHIDRELTAWQHRVVTPERGVS